MPKRERLQESYRRLAAAPAAGSFEEMFQQYASIMNRMEDELTDVPYSPADFLTDGRLYPPQRDRIVSESRDGRVVKLRSRGHYTFMGRNGSIEVTAKDGTVEFRKAGADGVHVWEQGA
ncbi:MAG TPA: hypothetical protein VF665_03690 [Longimicrobium sp.]